MHLFNGSVGPATGGPCTPRSVPGSRVRWALRPRASCLVVPGIWRGPCNTRFWVETATTCNAANIWRSQRPVKGFPGGTVVENLPANAGDTGSSPGLGGSHVPRSSWAREPQLLSLRVWSLCSATREAATVRPAHRNEEWPPLAKTRESPRTETKTQHSHK